MLQKWGNLRLCSWHATHDQYLLFFYSWAKFSWKWCSSYG